MPPYVGPRPGLGFIEGLTTKEVRSFPMDTQDRLPSPAPLRRFRGLSPPWGVVHITLPHTDRFTVVGNHLAQHPELSLAAIGLAVRIQSLPRGTDISVKTLAAQCREVNG
ncbi:hypothetical protein SCALM49S_02788 [Streptomyces californicus]